MSRGFGSSHDDAIRIGLVLPQGGEFGFVLFSGAAAAGLLDMEAASIMVAIVTLTMALTPPVMMLSRWLVRDGDVAETMDEDFEGAGSDVLVVGFSRFSQISSQVLLAGGTDVTIIDNSADRIRVAERFGFRIYFGDGRRKDVLEAAGIRRAKLVAVCTQKSEITNQIVELIRSEYPSAKLFVRSYDRNHSIHLRKSGVDYELRETFESGLVFGRETLTALGMDETHANLIMSDIRKRDAERLEMQILGGIDAGREKLHVTPATPEPLQRPKREGRILNADAVDHGTDPATQTDVGG